jgi:hypothetical protein
VRSRSLTVVPVVALAVTLLSGCVFSVGVDTAPTLPASEIADAAEGLLETETGVRPDIDCGTDPIPVEEGGSVTCLLLDPVAGLEFDVVMTFSEVDFPRYYLAVQVADVPNNAPQPTAEPGASVPINDIEALAIRALTPSLGFVPEVSCEGTEVVVAVGNTVDCSYPSPDGDVDVVVTITQFDPATGEYFINASTVELQ